MDLLYGVFSGDQKKVLSYIPDSDSQIRQKEVSDMLSMIPMQKRKVKNAGASQNTIILSEAGVCSRREADRQVEAGNVTIDGVVASW